MSAENPETIESEYRGKLQPLFGLALKTTLMTLLTLGIYRFWARTRLRRFYWSAIAPGSDPLEYTGNGLEKLLGFLIAVAVLAIYLGFFQVVLGFAGMSIFSGGESDTEAALQLAATQASFLAILPLIFYAQYRGRRYILARSRWRGLRFGAENGAWGYCWRALLHWLVTILTLGILLPRQSFWLEKFKADRTWFGDVKFEQQGRWQDLFPAMKHFLIGIGIFLIGFCGVAIAIVNEAPAMGGLLGVFVFIGIIWIMVGVVSYRVGSFRILTKHKLLGENIRLTVTPHTSTVFKIYFLGGTASGFLASTVAGLLIGIGYGAINSVGFELQGNYLQFFALGEGMSTGEILGLIGVVAFYLLFMLFLGVFNHICITQPLIRHYVSGLKIHNTEELETVTQRARDDFTEAEGFADALDVGASI